MNPSPLNSIDRVDWSDTIVALETAHFDWAVRVSQALPTEARQWQTYLQVLALAGFQEWLSRRAPELTVQTNAGSSLNPAYANVLDAICHLAIADLQVCLLVMEHPAQGVVSIPRAVVDLPEFAAHFYVFVEVLEEQEEVIIHSVLRSDRLLNHLAAHHLQPQPNWTYWLPLAWLDQDLTPLIVTLRYPAIYPLSLPQPPARLASRSQHQGAIAAALTASINTDRPLWEVLSWAEGMIFLTTPELVTGFYQQQVPPTTTAAATLPSQRHPLTHPIINTWHWAQGTLDEIALSQGWFLQPALTPVGVLRSDSDSDKDPIAALAERGITLPPQAYKACNNFPLENEKLCLSAISSPATVAEPNPEAMPEWQLVVVLEAQPDQQGVTLQVSDEQAVLAELHINAGEHACLYVCVVGGQDEQFTVTIKPTNGLATLLPFVFQPKP